MHPFKCKNHPGPVCILALGRNSHIVTGVSVLFTSLNSTMKDRCVRCGLKKIYELCVNKHLSNPAGNAGETSVRDRRHGYFSKSEEKLTCWETFNLPRKNFWLCRCLMCNLSFSSSAEWDNNTTGLFVKILISHTFFSNFHVVPPCNECRLCFIPQKTCETFNGVQSAGCTQNRTVL